MDDTTPLIVSGILRVTATPEQVPPIFSQCARDFRVGHDEKYANCSITTGEDPCSLLRVVGPPVTLTELDVQELHKAKDFRTYFLAVLPIIFSIIAFIINTVYIIVTIIVYIKENSSYRKRYLFLISRSLSSLMVLILFYIVLICWQSDGFLYSSAMIFMLLGGINFLSTTGTYIGLTCLLYSAVVYPIFYKTKLTLKHCYFIIISIWLISAAVSVCVGLWGATLFYPETAPVRCSFGKCQKPLAIVIVICLSLCYTTVLGVYAILFIKLRRRSNKTFDHSSSTSERQRSHVVAMNRLSLNMLTFAVGSIPILIVCIVALANLKQLSSLGEGKKSPCKTYLNSHLFVQVEILASIAAIVWMLAMIIDPLINTWADQKISSTITRGISEAKQSIRSLRKRDTTEATEANSTQS